jgi:hypothetical protein
VVKKGPVRFSNGKKMADHSKTGLFVRFSNGFNKMAAKAIRKPDLKSVQKMTIRIPDSPVFGGSL